MEFVPVNIEQQLDLCLAFRRDAYAVSYGSLDGFNTEDTTAWFGRLASLPDAGFYHAIKNEETIGQIEFRKDLMDDEGVKYGYINLFYLKPEFRGQGLGSELQDFIFSQLKSAKCQYVQLRYLPANSQGVAFYRKHGWKDVGEMDTRGQLAQKRIPE
ncbi:GNAT family N-acetyltransferase [Vibrio natriegens]|uniref:GNAT family N-acetyltransferase n=1 Tax=Vibrio natriegens TaxID=691 RepID=UPI003B5B8BB3